MSNAGSRQRPRRISTSAWGLAARIELRRALLSRHAEPLPAASIARDLGLPRSSVYHLLKVLHSRGFVTCEDSPWTMESGIPRDG